MLLNDLNGISKEMYCENIMWENLYPFDSHQWTIVRKRSIIFKPSTLLELATVQPRPSKPKFRWPRFNPQRVGQYSQQNWICRLGIVW